MSLRSHGIFLCAVALAWLASGCSRRETASPQAPGVTPVILISIDTLRADHLPSYGYAGVKTPHIDSLRADGILYLNAWSHVPLTLPSHVSMLTGSLPFEHGVRNNLGYRYKVDSNPPITFALRKSGYETGAAVSAYVLRGETGLRAAFDHYDDLIPSRQEALLGELSRPSEATIEFAESWIVPRASKPFFLFLHLFDPHAPYQPAEPFRSETALPYDGEIAAVDSALGSFFQKLKALGVYDRALIILTSDHGEGLSQHGEPEHGIFVYREALHVPLIVKLPHSLRKGEQVAAAAQLIDLPPTIAEVTGAEWPAARGTSLLALTTTSSRTIYSESHYARIHLGWSELQSIITAGHHFIDAPGPELYDLKTDSAERQNLADGERRLAASLKQQLTSFAGAFSAPSAVSAEEARRLASLGYLGSAAERTENLPDPKEQIKNLQPMLDAQKLSREGRREEAIRIYQQILATNPRFTIASTELARELEQSGRAGEAIEVYRAAVHHSPSLASNFALQIGTLLMESGKLEQALEHGNAAVGVNPGAAHQLLARVALRKKDFRTAEIEAEKAMQEGPTRFTAAITLAQARVAQGRQHEALRLLDQIVLEAARGRTPVEFLQFSRGSILMIQSRRSEAGAAFQKEIAAFPSHLRAYASLAIVETLDGHLTSAKETLEEMVRNNPGPEALRLAAQTQEALGNAKDAAAWRKRAAASQRTSRAIDPPSK